MKKVIFLAAVLLSCFACSKDDQDDENIYGVTSDHYFAASMDGVPLIIEADNKNYYNFGYDDGGETTEGFLQYKGSFFATEDEDTEAVTILFVKNFDGEPTNCTEISTMLGIGSEDYTRLTSIVDVTMTDGVIIYYVDGNGVEWSTASNDGEANKGDFKITEITKYKNDPTTCTVKGRFNCTLYNDYGTSVELTDGVFCASFTYCEEGE